MIIVTEVSSGEELMQVHSLNKKYMKNNLAGDDKSQGFLTWLYPVELLQQMHQLAPSVIAKDDDKVIGYALVTPIEATAFHPQLKDLVHYLGSIQYKQKPILSYDFYFMGQVCVHENYRGQGVFNQLYQAHRQRYAAKYELLVTEISTANTHSQIAHEKLGFKTIHTYTDELDEWNLVVWDWR